MNHSYSDLQTRIVQALRDADELGLADVGIALDMARLQIEKAIVEADQPAGAERLVNRIP